MPILESKNDVPAFHARTRREWRRWLQKNHASAENLWLIIYHKADPMPSVYYDEAVEEALCFGWVDSKTNRRNGNSYYLFFSPRNPRSNWSRLNRERVQKLTDAGLMAPAGLAMVAIAKESGTWTALEDVENGVIPDDLNKLLSTNKKALNNFLSFPPSSRRIILAWICSAKQARTRQRRIQQTVELAAQGIKANHYRQ